MQHIEIDIIGAETPDASLERTREKTFDDLVCLHLGDDKHTVALTGNRAAKQFLGSAAFAVISRRVDDRHAERDAGAQRLFLNGQGMAALGERPGALTERGDDRATGKFYGTGFGLRFRSRKISRWHDRPGARAIGKFYGTRFRLRFRSRKISR